MRTEREGPKSDDAVEEPSEWRSPSPDAVKAMYPGPRPEIALG